MHVHTVLAVWIVGPSAIGSVKGAPTSITSEGNILVNAAHRHRCERKLTSAALLQSQENVGSIFRLGVTSGDICYQCRLDEGKESIVSFFDHGIIEDLPRGGALMMDDVLTLFCSLQRLKVCLIASMAKIFFVSGLKKDYDREGMLSERGPVVFKKILKSKLIVTAFSATDRGRMNSATCQ
jgi:hypothetical protein